MSNHPQHEPGSTTAGLLAHAQQRLHNLKCAPVTGAHPAVIEGVRDALCVLTLTGTRP
jgi:hypothetical protein